MERPALSRLAALVIVAAALAVAALERRSPLARAAREGRPSPAWLAAPDGLQLAVYHPVRRTLDLVQVPDEALGKPRRGIPAPRGTAAADAAAKKLAALAPSGPDWAALPVLESPLPGSDPIAAKERLEALVQGARFWRALRRVRSFEGFLLALELHRLPAGAVRPAWLPGDDAAPGYLARLLGAAPDAPPTGPLAVEVLNGTGRPGLASQAKKILRLRGADVVDAANADAPAARTLVYDRTGRFENAEAVRAMLGCGAAAAATRIDARRVVDVTVVLAEDCPMP